MGGEGARKCSWLLYGKLSQLKIEEKSVLYIFFFMCSVRDDKGGDFSPEMIDESVSKVGFS